MPLHAKSLVRLGGVALVAAACAFFVRRLDFAAVGAALRGTSALLLGAAALVNLLHQLARSLRLEALLLPWHRVPQVRLYRYGLAFNAGNNLLPARAGEAVRIWLLHSRERIPASAALSAVVLEKVCDVVALLVLVAPVPLLLPLPQWVGRTITSGVVATLVACALFGLFLHAHRDQPRSTLRGRLVVGARALANPRLLAGVASTSVATWILDGAVLVLVLGATQTHVSFAGALFVLLTVNLAIALPSTPAQVGAFEVGAVAALKLLGLSEERALAAALLYHLVQVVPVTLLGLPDLLLITRARAAARAGSSPAAPGATPGGT